MKSKRLIRLSLVGLIAMPISIFFNNELLANNLFNQEILLAMGGGHGGGGHSGCSGRNKPGALKLKKTTSKLSWKKRQLVKADAAGEDTSSLLSEIAELEAIIEKLREKTAGYHR